MSFQREDNSRIKRWSQRNVLSPNRVLIIYAKLSSRKYNMKNKMSSNGKKRGSTCVVSPAKLEIQKAVPN